MNFHVMTLFPEMIRQGVHTSITGKAMDKGVITLNAVDIRDFSADKHRHVDDYPYGGGAGMVMQPQPVYDCYQSIAAKIHSRTAQTKKPRVIYMTPQGQVFSQSIAEELSKEDDLIFLCGHYEGIDERVLEEIVTDNLSIGDYVLTGGELAAMVMIDAIARLVPGVLNNEESAQYESFQDGLLEYPQYTRPVEFKGRKVPEVLLTGNHPKIEDWRRSKSLERTYQRRPELLEAVNLEGRDVWRLAYIKEALMYESGGYCWQKADEKAQQWLMEDAASLLQVMPCLSDIDADDSVVQATMLVMRDLLTQAEALDAQTVYDAVDLGESMSHLFAKDAKKFLKQIVRHLKAGSRVRAVIYKEVPADWQCLEKNIYTDGQMIRYHLGETVWEAMFSQWFQIVHKRENGDSIEFWMTPKITK